MEPQTPIIVSYGAGVDSTAMVVWMRNSGYRPEAILFADTGGEKPETYAFIETMSTWLLQAQHAACDRSHEARRGRARLEGRFHEPRDRPG